MKALKILLDARPGEKIIKNNTYDLQIQWRILLLKITIVFVIKNN